METLNRPFKNLEELNQYLTLNVLYQLKLDLSATSLDIRIYDDEVRLIVKTQGYISKMPLIINTCSKWKAYAVTDYMVFEFVFILDE